MVKMVHVISNDGAFRKRRDCVEQGVWGSGVAEWELCWVRQVADLEEEHSRPRARHKEA